MSATDITFGIHAIQALLKTAPQRVLELLVFVGRQDQKIQKIIALAEKQGIAVHSVEKKTLDTLCDGNHQGVVARVRPGRTLQENDLYPMLEQAADDSLVLVLDGVTDPHNLGACLRSADAVGVIAVVIPKDNSVGVTEVARKVASGAAESVPVIAVTNLARSLKKMQELGYWVTGLAGEAELSAFDSDLDGRRVIVMGAEGDGMRRLTRETCDSLVHLPMCGAVSSLNVSVATGVILYEALRQRRLKRD